MSPVGWKEASSGAWEEHLLYYRSIFDLFVEHATRASDSIWGRGEGPFSDLQGDLAWLSPDLGPRAQELRQSSGSTELFGFMMCFPDASDKFKATSDLMLSVFLMDDWIEQQSAPEAEQLAEWWAMLWLQSKRGEAFDPQQALEALPASLTTHPSAQKGGELCTSALAFIHKSAAEVDPAWFWRFAWASQLYAKGVASEVEQTAAVKVTGKSPTAIEYLTYRCFSSAFIQLAVLAALQRGIRLSEERFESARVLLMCASLVACCFNDAFVASKDAADGLVNIVKIEGKRRAVDMHNVLVDCLCEEADEWLAGASEGDDSQKFVDVLKASTFGCNLWHNTCSRYRKYLRETRQPFGLFDGPVGTLSADHSQLKLELKELLQSLALRKAARNVLLDQTCINQAQLGLRD